MLHKIVLAFLAVLSAPLLCLAISADAVSVGALAVTATVDSYVTPMPKEVGVSRSVRCAGERRDCQARIDDAFSSCVGIPNKAGMVLRDCIGYVQTTYSVPVKVHTYPSEQLFEEMRASFFECTKKKHDVMINPPGIQSREALWKCLDPWNIGRAQCQSAEDQCDPTCDRFVDCNNDGKNDADPESPIESFCPIGEFCDVDISRCRVSDGNNCLRDSDCESPKRCDEGACKVLKGSVDKSSLREGREHGVGIHWGICPYGTYPDGDSCKVGCDLDEDCALVPDAFTRPVDLRCRLNPGHDKCSQHSHRCVAASLSCKITCNKYEVTDRDGNTGQFLYDWDNVHSRWECEPVKPLPRCDEKSLGAVVEGYYY